MSFKSLLFKGFAFVLAAHFSQGCSNNFVDAISPKTYSFEQSQEYFPLSEGYQSTFEISSISSTPQIVSYTVGSEVIFNGLEATEWIKYQNYDKDTSFFVQNGSSLIFYETKNASPEVILDLPLAVGKSWSRFEVTETQVTDTTGSEGGIVIKDSTDLGADLASTFPTEGKSLMIVDKTESVELSKGEYYSGVFRVSNDAGNNTRNYYWYAPGIGLIKYMYGATNSDQPSGGVTAELVSHGYKY